MLRVKLAIILFIYFVAKTFAVPSQEYKGIGALLDDSSTSSSGDIDNGARPMLKEDIGVIDDFEASRIFETDEEIENEEEQISDYFPITEAGAKKPVKDAQKDPEEHGVDDSEISISKTDSPTENIQAGKLNLAADNLVAVSNSEPNKLPLVRGNSGGPTNSLQVTTNDMWNILYGKQPMKLYSTYPDGIQPYEAADFPRLQPKDILVTLEDWTKFSNEMMERGEGPIPQIFNLLREFHWTSQFLINSQSIIDKKIKEWTDDHSEGQQGEDISPGEIELVTSLAADFSASFMTQKYSPALFQDMLRGNILDVILVSNPDTKEHYLELLYRLFSARAFIYTNEGEGTDEVVELDDEPMKYLAMQITFQKRNLEDTIKAMDLNLELIINDPDLTVEGLEEDIGDQIHPDADPTLPTKVYLDQKYGDLIRGSVLTNLGNWLEEASASKRDFTILIVLRQITAALARGVLPALLEMFDRLSEAATELGKKAIVKEIGWGQYAGYKPWFKDQERKELVDKGFVYVEQKPDAV
ncbi:hypothetical protein ABW19_dt0203915 [Dactylella cylindrospora]|nr:hypothetical protein ABW19_dt0203915 [Dactylella cylindrospora]